MSRPLWRPIAVCSFLALTAVACGNSDESSDPTTTTAGDGGTSAPAEGDRDTFVEISGVPGVTDDEIAYTAIGTRSGNPLGTCILDCYVDGINAYFAFRNDEGGIYGRELTLSEEVDDELSMNQVKALDVTSGDDVFGVFEATLLATGWGDLDSAGVPTYAWGIHANEAANRTHIFPSAAVRCAECTGRSVPFAVQDAGATKVASLGYGATENSKVCAQNVAESVGKYSEDIGAETVYLNDELDYGLPGGVGPEVTAMKKAGVDFVNACIDLNGMKTLAQELERQGMGDVPMYHPNTYSQSFVSEAGDLFEGDYVAVQFRPFEGDPDGTAMEDFLSWMDEQGSEPTELAMVGWLNASVAFDGLLAAGPDFDRQKVTDATNAITDYTAGGLLAPIDWSSAHTPVTQAEATEEGGLECQALVKVEDGEFVTVTPPSTPWLCWSRDDLNWSDPEPTNFG